MTVLDKLATSEDLISPGISACVGCNVELALRTVLKVLGPNTVLAIPPGCMGGVGVVGWDKKSGAKVPVFFPLLDNVASMLAGIKLGFEARNRQVNVVAFAGDGATVDAGFQALSGAAERGDNIIYICLRQRRLHEHRLPTLFLDLQGILDEHNASIERWHRREKPAPQGLPHDHGLP